MSSARKYYAYLRVSTVRQGQTGTSLAQQRAAIEAYARVWKLPVVKEYEERETAAKLGRPVFLSMIKALRLRQADGVIMHKIDRSARNLKDWADLGELIDKGVEVHFANEILDLNSRGGRLSADIQAVIAADFIRNLREETRKGIYGRLKQGLFPFRAVTGYQDVGRGQPKEVDPIQAPLVKRAFELYSTGNWGLNDLAEEMYQLGLRSRTGRRLTRNGLSTVLNNPFYMGVVRIKALKEVFSGRHEPIIGKKLYDTVQAVLQGKNIKKIQKHFYVFSRHIVCSGCSRKLIAEEKKGYVYYRCQTKYCSQKCIREDLIEKEFGEVLKRIRFSARENEFFRIKLEERGWEMKTSIEAQKKELPLKLEQIKERLLKLTDGYLDRVFDEEIYKLKKNQLVLEEKEIREKLNELAGNPEVSLSRAEEFLELVNSAYSSYKRANAVEKRELVKTLTSNFTAEGKKVLFKLNLPFDLVANRVAIPNGSPYGATTRTFCGLLLTKLIEYYSNEVIVKNAE